MENNRVLIIAPHMDDEVLGCGGAICRYGREGYRVTVLFVAHRVYGHQFDRERNDQEKRHALKAREILQYDEAVFLDLSDERLDVALQEIIIPLEMRVNDVRPGTVFLPFRGDNNQDHRAVFDAARVALRPVATPYVNNIYMYEVPSSTDQSPPLGDTTFLPNFYIDIKGEIDRKVQALACYKTELRPYPHPRSEEALRVLARKRGIDMGFEYAEAFMMLRGKWVSQ